MRAEDLNIQDLISVKNGEINLRGRRLVLHSIHAFSQFRYDLLKMLGEDDARRLFTRFGFFWGQADAAALQRLFKWPTVEEWLKAGIKLYALEGAGQAKISELFIDKQNKKFKMDVSWHNSVEVEEHVMNMGADDKAVCWKYIGYVSGMTSYCMGQSIYFIESLCQGRRDGFCRAIGKDLESWGDEITPHLKYFEAEDIKGKVKRLTEELKEKTRALEKHKRELKRLRHRSVPYLAEGRSRKMQDVLNLASKVARYDSSVLITGETGTGKEVLARYIHDMSQRFKGPFVVINCLAMPESLLDSELFGHKAGSFTGAAQNRRGLFEEASNGTVFLDEIGELSQATQLKLLRVLQEKEILRIGENKPRKSNVRVIAATNKDLDQAVKDREFREDLLYRLKVIEIKVPSLRERKQDILPISQFLIQRISRKLGIESLRLDSECAESLEAYDWPGNIRELENALERAAVVSTDGVITQKHLPSRIVYQSRMHDKIQEGSDASLKQVEQAHIKRILNFAEGNKTKAAKILGISGATLWRKLKEID